MATYSSCRLCRRPTASRTSRSARRDPSRPRRRRGPRLGDRRVGVELEVGGGRLVLARRQLRDDPYDLRRVAVDRHLGLAEDVLGVPPHDMERRAVRARRGKARPYDTLAWPLAEGAVAVEVPVDLVVGD